MPMQNKVRHIETPEDYRDYLADKGLYEALMARDEIVRTKAVLAERERCAVIAEEIGIPRSVDNDRVMMIPIEIAAAIRKGD